MRGGAVFDPASQYRNDPTMSRVSLGIDTEHFVTSDKVGKYLIERAHRCRVEALEGLASANPTAVEEITRLQWEARVPDLFLRWLDEAIAEGRAAEEIILQEDADGL